MAAQMTEDQTLLKDAAERYLRDSYDFNERRERIAGGHYSTPHSGRLLLTWGGWHSPSTKISVAWA